MSNTDAKLARKDAILDRLEWLVKAIDGLDAIGRTAEADTYETECGVLVKEFEQLDAEIGAVFTPKLGRFR